jgi:uncharacterized protein YwqG
MLPSIVDSVFGVLVSPIYPPTSRDLDRFSHLGGLPSLPAGMEWPRAPNGAPFHFLAQIDLATVPASGIVDFRGTPLPEFPREGALYFFADCATFGIWEQPEASHRVLYAPDIGGACPVQPPPDLMPHNAPDAGVLVHMHAPYFPRLRPRPMVLLPHAPISLTEMPSVTPPSEAPRNRSGRDVPWTALLDTGFPWRWLLLERIAISVDAAAKKQEWPGGIREACIAWHRRASTEHPLARVPTAVADELCNWLRSLAAHDPHVRLYGAQFYVELCFWEAIRAARHYIAFSGDLSDIPAQLVQDWQPMERLAKGDGHHKMLGDVISVQAVQLADENNVLLLRLDSDEALGFCWGDAGILHIAVSRNDLAARNFARTHINADCS